MKRLILGILVLVLAFCGSFALADSTSRADHEALLLNGEWAEAEMHPDEYHYFPFTIEETGKLTARVQTFYASAEFELLDADLIPWANAYLSGSKGAPDTEDMEFYLEPGEYYLRSDGNSQSQGDFRVKLMFEPCACDEIAENEDYHGAQPLPIGETVSGVMTEWDAFDYYSFTLAADSTPYLTIYSESAGQQIATLYDADMVEIKTIYDLNTYAENLPLSAGTYYIAISGAKGAYTLKVAY